MIRHVSWEEYKNRIICKNLEHNWGKPNPSSRPNPTSASFLQPFAELERYVYPNALDTQTIIILVLCGLLVMGAVIAILLALRQRYV